MSNQDSPSSPEQRRCAAVRDPNAELPAGDAAEIRSGREVAQWLSTLKPIRSRTKAQIDRALAKERDW